MLLDDLIVEQRGGYLCDKCFEQLAAQNHLENPEGIDVAQKYRRICLCRYGYAAVPANTDKEVLEAEKWLSEKDFDWEPVKSDLLKTAEVVEVCRLNEKAV